MASQHTLGASPPQFSENAHLQHMGRSGNDPHERLFRDGIPDILSNVQDSSGIPYSDDSQSFREREMEKKVRIQGLYESGNLY